MDLTWSDPEVSELKLLIKKPQRQKVFHKTAIKYKPLQNNLTVFRAARATEEFCHFSLRVS